jgi:beta-N-acetylhexosaminidase
MRAPIAAAGCVVALTLAGATGCGGQRARSASTKPSAVAAKAALRLSLAQQVGQLLIVSFASPTLPAYAKRILREGSAAGVILFDYNLGSRAQARALTDAVQRAAGGSAIVCADQEGGPARALPWAAPSAAPGDQTTTAVAATEATRAARELRAAGVNVDLAPLADVARAGSIVRGRAFPGGPSQVAALVRAAVRAYARGRVGATAKHFPGLGDATRNTDDQPVTLELDPPALLRGLVPFRAAIDAGVPLVMASHALYPSFDAKDIASQSREILDGVLRRRLRFGGVVITDSMEARAVLARTSVDEAALRSVQAGADLVLMTGPGSWRPVYRRLLAEAHRSAAFRRRVADGAARVLALKRRLGLTAPAPVGR